MKAEIKKSVLSKIKKPIVLVSLPLAAVANVALNALVEQLHAELVGKLFVDKLPIVFVRKNKAEFPAIRLYYKKVRKENLLFVLSEYQPKEESIFALCSYIISLFKKLKGKRIIVLDGVKTAAREKEEKEGKESKILYIADKALGVAAQKVETIGPLFGSTAVLFQMAKQAGIDTVVLLTQVSDPKNVNIGDVRRNVLLLNSMLHLGINLQRFGAKIKNLKKGIKAARKIEGRILPSKEQRGYIG